jgi:hypothetical protein
MRGNIPLLHYTLSWGLQGLPYHHHHYPHALLRTSLAVLKTLRVSLTKYFLFTVLPKSDYRHVIHSTVFCILIYRPGRRLSSFKLACNLFGIIPIVDSTSGSTRAVFTFHILTSSFFKSVYFWSFSVMVQ